MTRRKLIGASAALAGTVSLPRGISAQDAASPEATVSNDSGHPEDGVQPDGSWAFTDDHGRTVTLPRPPQRIAAFVTAGSALWELGIQASAIFGSVHLPDGSLQPSVGSIDLDQVEILSEEYWAIDLEAFVAFGPDLIISTTWLADDPDEIWGIDAELFDIAQEIAPIIAINYGNTSLLNAVERFEDLAVALGADLNSPAIVADREAFEAARVAAQAAIAAKPGLTTAWVAGTPDGLWLCGPTAYADLQLFADLGLTIREGDSGTGSDLISWETVREFPVDVYFNDARATAAFYTVDELVSQPTMEFQPAVAAGQIESWYYEYILSRAGFTFNLNELTAAVERSQIVTSE